VAVLAEPEVVAASSCRNSALDDSSGNFAVKVLNLDQLTCQDSMAGVSRATFAKANTLTAATMHILECHKCCICVCTARMGHSRGQC
jgi:hypothetical protein